MKELKSFKDLSDAFKVSLISRREDIQTVLKESARKLVDELNGDVGDGEPHKNSAKPDSPEARGRKSFSYELDGDAFVIASNDRKIVERELGIGVKKPAPSLQATLIAAIPEIEKQIGESLTATLAGET